MIKDWPKFPSTGHTKFNGCTVIYSLDDTGPDKFGPLRHVSLSRKFGFPTWLQILQVKDKWFGDIDCMMVLPKKKDYVNVHDNCFHIWECPEEWGIM